MQTFMAPALSSEQTIAELPQKEQNAVRAEVAAGEDAKNTKAGSEGAAIKVVYICLFVEVRGIAQHMYRIFEVDVAAEREEQGVSRWMTRETVS